MINSINTSKELGINQADYLKLFMQELTYQDPLKPVDNKEFMAQMAQFSALQEAQTSNQILDMLTGLSLDIKGLMLLGKKVTIKDNQQEALVNKIEWSTNGQPLIHLLMNNGERAQVNLSELTSVWNAAK